MTFKGQRVALGWVMWLLQQGIRVGFILPDISQQQWVNGARALLQSRPWKMDILGDSQGNGALLHWETMGVTWSWFLCQNTVSFISAPCCRRQKGMMRCTDGEGEMLRVQRARRWEVPAWGKE